MAAMNIKERQTAFANSATGYVNPGMMLGHHSATQAQALRAQPYLPTGPAMLANTHGDPALAALAHGFGSMNLHNSSFGSSAKGGSQISTTSSEYNGMHLAQGQALYMPGQQQLYFPGAHAIAGANQTHSGLPHTSGMFNPMAQFMHQNNYSAYPQHTLDSPLAAQNWTPRVPSGEMPTLVTPRRDSISSNENDLPGTPYTGYGAYQNGFAVVDRSPSVGYAHSGTPSPSQLAHPYSVPQVGKPQPVATIDGHLQRLLEQHPRIPRAIPAPSSPMKPLDRSLENKNGETNVYIRGLMPDTTDEMLYSWGIRFGDIQSSKSIIDLKTNKCKGFGFIKYHNYEDAGNCIRGFYHLGYEVSFARESFYAKLKKFSDESNTNLYVSNIPRNMNEHELSGIFAPHKVCSARILRDSSGNGRGVGFARFETRDVCEEVIKHFNNHPFMKNGEEYQIQIRYSDTHEQKMLKQQTAAARQFRAAEFEYGVIQARNSGLLPPAQERANGLSASEQDAANEFENFLSATANNYAPRYPNSSLRFAPRVALPFNPGTANSAALQSAAPKIEETAEDVKRPATPVVAHGDSASSKATSEHE